MAVARLRAADYEGHELPGPDVASRGDTFYTLAVLVPLVLLGFLLLRRREGGPARPARALRGRVALGGIIMTAALFRLVVAGYLGPGDLELEAFPQDTNLWALSHILGSFVHPPPPQTYHAPLMVSLLQGWSLLGDRHPGHLTWTGPAEGTSVVWTRPEGGGGRTLLDAAGAPAEIPKCTRTLIAHQIMDRLIEWSAIASAAR